MIQWGKKEAQKGTDSWYPLVIRSSYQALIQIQRKFCVAFQDAPHFCSAFLCGELDRWIGWGR